MESAVSDGSAVAGLDIPGLVDQARAEHGKGEII